MLKYLNDAKLNLSTKSSERNKLSDEAKSLCITKILRLTIFYNRIFLNFSDTFVSRIYFCVTELLVFYRYFCIPSLFDLFATHTYFWFLQ